MAFVTILRWRSQPRTSTLPGERFVGAMRVGWQHVMQSPRMRSVLVRIFFFFLHSSALLALLPLVARNIHGAGPATYTLMLACIGGGAVVAALYFPRWRMRFNRDQFVIGGTLTHAAMSVVVVFAPNIWIALPAIVVLGMAWISTANSLTLAAQVALPNWVRARGMAIYQMALMGGAAAGSLLWGQVAGWSSVRIAVTCAAVVGPVLWLLTRRLTVEGGADPDFSPAKPRATCRMTAIDVGARRRPGDGDGGVPDRPGRRGGLCRGDAEDAPRAAAPGRACRGGCSATRRRRVATSSTSSTRAGSSICAGWSASPPPMPACANKRLAFHQGGRPARGAAIRRRRTAVDRPLALVKRWIESMCVVVGAGVVGLARGARAGAGRTRGGRARGRRGHRHRHQFAQQRGHPRRAVLPAGLAEGAAVRARA